MWVLEDLGPGLEGLSMGLFTRILGWSKEETDIFLATVRRDMKDTKIHAYWNMWVPYFNFQLIVSNVDSGTDILFMLKSHSRIAPELVQNQAFPGLEADTTGTAEYLSKGRLYVNHSSRTFYWTAT